VDSLVRHNDANKGSAKGRVDAVKFENYYQEDAYQKNALGTRRAAEYSEVFTGSCSTWLSSKMWRVRVTSCMNEYLGQG
jgi:hypothetical protein